MANTDISQTLAAQFARNVLSERQQLMIQCLGLELIITGGTKPTAAQWNTVMASASKLAPPTIGIDQQAIRSAVYWQNAVTAVGSGLAVSGQSNSAILNGASYLQGMDDPTLKMLILFLEGRNISVFS